MKKFINIVLNGYIGLLFPLVICIILIEKLLHLISPLISFIEDKLHVTHILGVIGIILISALLLILLGYLAGILFKSRAVKKKIETLENKFLEKIPLYNILKTVLDKEINPEKSNSFKPALIKEKDFFLLGFVTSESENYYTVNICEGGAISGRIEIVPKDVVRFLDISFIDFMKKIKQYGINSAQFAEND